MKTKALLVSLSLMVLAFSMKGQSLIVEQYDSLIVGDATTDNDIYSYSAVKNVSNDSVLVGFKRIDGNYNALTDSNAICWGICFIPSISIAPASFAQWIQPNDTAIAITHVYPDQDGYTREGDITYVFYNINDVNDTVDYTVTYKVNGIPLSNEEFERPSISVYPNPAQDFLNVNYSLGAGESGRFEMINLVGSKVYSTELSKEQSQLEINLSQLKAGVYFYSLRVNGETAISKKLVIK